MTLQFSKPHNWSLWKRTERGHLVELIGYREVIDSDGTAFHQFTFAVDGRPVPPWEIPKSHRVRFNSEEEFDCYLARSAIGFAGRNGSEASA